MPLRLEAIFTADPAAADGNADEEAVGADAAAAGAHVRAAPAFRLELGCGAGEWLAAQAVAAPEVHWLALELRRDRAHATAARLALEGLTNAATLSGDAAHVRARRIEYDEPRQAIMSDNEPRRAIMSPDDEPGRAMMSHVE